MSPFLFPVASMLSLVLKLGPAVHRNGSLKIISIVFFCMLITTVWPPNRLPRLPSLVEYASIELSEEENDTFRILVVLGELQNYWRKVSCFVTRVPSLAFARKMAWFEDPWHAQTIWSVQVEINNCGKSTLRELGKIRTELTVVTVADWGDGWQLLSQLPFVVSWGKKQDLFSSTLSNLRRRHLRVEGIEQVGGKEHRGLHF